MRYHLTWLTSITETVTGSADVLLAISKFTANGFNTFFDIPRIPEVVYPGINLTSYEPPSNMDDPDIQAMKSSVDFHA